MADETRTEEAAEDLPLDVRAVLDQIGAEEAVARLEARIEGLEQDLERAADRQREADRSRQGELEMMRARVDDAMELVRSTLDEQRGAWQQFEVRFLGAVSEAEALSERRVEDLRQDLMPAVERTRVQADELRSQVTGDLGSVRADLETQVSTVGDRLADVRAELGAVVEGLTRRVEEEVEQRPERERSLERHLTERVDALASEVRSNSSQLDERAEALRRELDGAVGELRAGINLRANELSDGLAHVHEELATAIDEQADAAAELERRWIDGTSDLARRVERLDTELRQVVQQERGARARVDDELARRLDDVAGAVEELHARVGAGETRGDGDREALRRDLDEVVTRLDVLQSKVAHAVGRIASDLTNRVATTASGLDALRESVGRIGERLAAVDHLERHVQALADERRDAPATALDDERLEELRSGVRAIRAQVGELAEGLSATTERLGELTARVEAGGSVAQSQERLRQEVRDLAARTAEMSTRLSETEELARAAGRAIASAVRRARASGRREGGAPGAERPAVYADRQPALQRDDEGRPLVGIEQIRRAVEDPPEMVAEPSDDDAGT